MVFAILLAIETLVLVVVVRQGNPRADQIKEELNECKTDRDDYRRRYYQRTRELEAMRLKNHVLAKSRIAIQQAIAEFDPVNKMADEIVNANDIVPYPN